jgi:hypothetical protein
VKFPATPAPRFHDHVKFAAVYDVFITRSWLGGSGYVFRILADPRSHPGIDGSGMLRGAVSGAVISGVGDVFVMKMYYSELGDYEMNNHIVEFEPNRRIGWEPEAGRGHPEAGGAWGQRWSFELTPDGPDATIVTEIYDCSRRTGAGARWYGRRPGLDREHDQDAGAARRSVLRPGPGRRSGQDAVMQ